MKSVKPSTDFLFSAVLSEITMKNMMKLEKTDFSYHSKTPPSSGLTTPSGKKTSFWNKRKKIDIDEYNGESVNQEKRYLETSEAEESDDISIKVEKI